MVVVLSPHSQPAYLLHADAVAAMAAGCTVVCKPSELTPATGQLYAEIVGEADLPRGVFNLVQGDAATGAALTASPLAQGVLFAGSEANGRRLVEAVAARPGERVLRTLLSGQAAAIVADDANLDEAAYQIVIGACAGSGQRCTSTRRVIADRRIVDPLAGKLVHLLQHLKVGHSSDAGELHGPADPRRASSRSTWPSWRGSAARPARSWWPARLSPRDAAASTSRLALFRVSPEAAAAIAATGEHRAGAGA